MAVEAQDFLDRYAAAYRAELKRAVELDPALVERDVRRGAIYIQNGKWKKATIVLQGALAMDANSAAAHFHLGLAYDGDGDRLALVDEQGQRVLGDQIMMILARDALGHGPAKVVYEILCTRALADDVAAHGGEPVMTPSGYAFVHEAMQQTGAALGGELSGHLFFKEPDFRFDDTILATVKFLNIMTRSGRPVSDLVTNLPTYHSSTEIRLPCPDTAKAAVVRDFIAGMTDENLRLISAPRLISAASKTSWLLTGVSCLPRVVTRVSAHGGARSACASGPGFAAPG